MESIWARRCYSFCRKIKDTLSCRSRGSTQFLGASLICMSIKNIPSWLLPAARTGSKFLTYSGHTNAVYAVEWSPLGTYIASGGEDATVRYGKERTNHLWIHK